MFVEYHKIIFFFELRKNYMIKKLENDELKISNKGFQRYLLVIERKLRKF